MMGHLQGRYYFCTVLESAKFKTDTPANLVHGNNQLIDENATLGPTGWEKGYALLPRILSVKPKLINESLKSIFLQGPYLLKASYWLLDF